MLNFFSAYLRLRYLPHEIGRIFVTVVDAPVFDHVLERQWLPLSVNCNLFQLMPHVLLSPILTSVILEGKKKLF